MVFYKKLTENWNIEIQLEKFENWSNVFLIEMSQSNKTTDHYGFKIHIEVWKFFFSFLIYNRNHGVKTNEHFKR